jgi:hypothetical protein
MDMTCPFPHKEDDAGAFGEPDFESGHPLDFPCEDHNLGRVMVAEAVDWACHKAWESQVDPAKSGKR